MYPIYNHTGAYCCPLPSPMLFSGGQRLHAPPQTAWLGWPAWRISRGQQGTLQKRREERNPTQVLLRAARLRQGRPGAVTGRGDGGAMQPAAAAAACSKNKGDLETRFAPVHSTSSPNFVLPEMLLSWAIWAAETIARCWFLTILSDLHVSHCWHCLGNIWQLSHMFLFDLVAPIILNNK